MDGALFMAFSQVPDGGSSGWSCCGGQPAGLDGEALLACRIQTSRLVRLTSLSMVDLTFRWLITDEFACKPLINPRRYQLGGAGAAGWQHKCHTRERDPRDICHN
jgi:hypothetical protein